MSKSALICHADVFWLKHHRVVSPSQNLFQWWFLRTLKNAPLLQQRSCAGISPGFLCPLCTRSAKQYSIIKFSKQKSYHSSRFLSIQASISFSKRSHSASIATRSCFMLSRSRTVTVLSSSVLVIDRNAEGSSDFILVEIALAKYYRDHPSSSPSV